MTRPTDRKPPTAHGRDLGLIAVEDAYAEILTVRNPGTSWTSARRAELAGAPLADGCVARLFPAAPDDNREAAS